MFFTSTNAGSAAEAIDQGEPIRALRQFFPDSQSTLSFYSDYQSRRYSAVKAHGPCICCGKAANRIGTYLWRAYYDPSWKSGIFGAIILIFGSVFLWLLRQLLTMRAIEFCTSHPICATCWRAAKLKRIAATGLEFSGKFAACFGLVAGLFGLLGIWFYGGNRQTQDWVHFCFKSALLGLAVLALAIAAIIWANRLRVPRGLRSIPRSPFAYAGLRS